MSEPINPRTHGLTIAMIRVVFAHDDLNAGVEAAAFVLAQLSDLITRDELVDREAFAVALLAHAFEQLDQRHAEGLAATALAEAKEKKAP